MQYILKDRKVIRCPGVKAWLKWYLKANKHVAITRFLGDEVSDILVVTSFIGFNYCYDSFSLPLVFETTVYRGPYDGEQWQYATWEEAEVGHYKLVAKIEEHSQVKYVPVESFPTEKKKELKVFQKIISLNP